jgi:hypothetical protein
MGFAVDLGQLRSRTCPLVIPAAYNFRGQEVGMGSTMRSPVKFGGSFYSNLRGGVIVEVAAIGLARFLTVLRLAC